MSSEQDAGIRYILGLAWMHVEDCRTKRPIGLPQIKHLLREVTDVAQSKADEALIECYFGLVRVRS